MSQSNSARDFDRLVSDVKSELREVCELLEGAEQIASGLVAVCERAYRDDDRTSPALAAAVAAAVAITEVREAAEMREDRCG